MSAATQSSTDWKVRPARITPLVASVGLGVDSTAMLVLFKQQGRRPDAILFANTGGEKDETLAFLPVLNAWCVSVGFPEITVVTYVPQNFKHYPPYYTLEQNCLTNGTLPSEAFGFGSCSIKWKAEPQKKWLQTWQPALDCWAAGGQVIRAIGFDASGADQKRSYAAAKIVDPLFAYWYPLQDAGWDRERCKAEIAKAGLPVPPKSSCFFCPNMSPAEILELDPKYLRRIVMMEARAKPRLRKIQGLWRNGVKGVRDPSKKRPGRMTDFIVERKLLPVAEVLAIEAGAPRELIDRAEAFANGLQVETWDALFGELGGNADLDRVAA